MTSTWLSSGQWPRPTALSSEVQFSPSLDPSARPWPSPAADAAWQLFAEERCGSIAVGKYADFAVLERNPLEVPPEELDTIAVTGTWLGGRPAE